MRHYNYLLESGEARGDQNKPEPPAISAPQTSVDFRQAGRQWIALMLSGILSRLRNKITATIIIFQEFGHLEVYSED